MSDYQGRFVWYDLMTTDVPAAQAFYTKVVGWTAAPMAQPGMTYVVLSAGATGIGGLMELPKEARDMGAPPSWSGYIAVDDVDAVTKKVKKLGGTIHSPPRDIPNVGRFAVVADPQMAAFMLFKPTMGSADAQPPEPPPGTPGTVGWRELLASDWEKEFAFYSTLFGWRKDQAMDMGQMGVYQLFAAMSGPAIGAMYNKPATVPANFWLYYFNVEAIDAAAERVKAGGGKILNGPMEVPGPSYIVQCMDPQGAMFALVAPRR